MAAFHAFVECPGSLYFHLLLIFRHLDGDLACGDISSVKKAESARTEIVNNSTAVIWCLFPKVMTDYNNMG